MEDTHPESEGHSSGERRIRAPASRDKRLGEKNVRLDHEDHELNEEEQLETRNQKPETRTAT